MVHLPLSSWKHIYPDAFHAELFKYPVSYAILQKKDGIVVLFLQGNNLVQYHDWMKGVTDASSNNFPGDLERKPSVEKVVIPEFQSIWLKWKLSVKGLMWKFRKETERKNNGDSVICCSLS